jgi:hypothetical protein
MEKLRQTTKTVSRDVRVRRVWVYMGALSYANVILRQIIWDNESIRLILKDLAKRKQLYFSIFPVFAWRRGGYYEKPEGSCKPEWNSNKMVLRLKNKALHDTWSYGVRGGSAKFKSKGGRENVVTRAVLLFTLRYQTLIIWTAYLALYCGTVENGKTKMRSKKACRSVASTAFLVSVSVSVSVISFHFIFIHPIDQYIDIGNVKLVLVQTGWVQVSVGFLLTYFSRGSSTAEMKEIVIRI